MSSSLSFNINIELKKVIKDDFNFANSLTKGQSNYILTEARFLAMEAIYQGVMETKEDNNLLIKFECPVPNKESETIYVEALLTWENLGDDPTDDFWIDL